MHGKCKSGTANPETLSYKNRQGLHRGSNHKSTASLKISNTLWHMESVMLKEQKHVIKYRTGTFTMKTMPSASTATLDLLCVPYVAHLVALSTLCSNAHPHINRMHITCYNEALSICGEGFSKGDLVTTTLHCYYGCMTLQCYYRCMLSSLEMEVPYEVQRGVCRVESWLLLDHVMCSQVGDMCVTLILHDTFPNGCSHLGSFPEHNRAALMPS
eukprot:1138909-Pelagomonas_calceolata.AAC.3